MRKVGIEWDDATRAVSEEAAARVRAGRGPRVRGAGTRHARRAARESAPGANGSGRCRRPRRAPVLRSAPRSCRLVPVHDRAPRGGRRRAGVGGEDPSRDNVEPRTIPGPTGRDPDRGRPLRDAAPGEPGTVLPPPPGMGDSILRSLGAGVAASRRRPCPRGSRWSRAALLSTSGFSSPREIRPSRISGVSTGSTRNGFSCGDRRRPSTWATRSHGSAAAIR